MEFAIPIEEAARRASIFASNYSDILGHSISKQGRCSLVAKTFIGCHSCRSTSDVARKSLDGIPTAQVYATRFWGLIWGL